MQAAPATNYFQATALGIKGGTTDAQAALFRFVVPTAPAGTQVKSVTLRLMTGSSTAAASTSTFAVRITGDTWVSSTVTWNSRPSLSGTQVGTFTAPSAVSTWYAAALTPSTVAAARTSAGNVDLAVTSTATDNWAPNASDYSVASARPQLVVTFG